MKKARVVVALVASFVSGAACAETSNATIAIVDMQRVIDQSIVGKAARNSVEAEAKKSQAKIAQIKSEFDRAKADLDKQASLLSGTALEERREQLLRRQRELERALQDAREDLMRKNGTQVGKVVEEVDAVVKDMAKAKKYDFVMERDDQTIVYADSRLDVTDEVIKTLDQRKVSF